MCFWKVSLYSHDNVPVFNNLYYSLGLFQSLRMTKMAGKTVNQYKLIHTPVIARLQIHTVPNYVYKSPHAGITLLCIIWDCFNFVVPWKSGKLLVISSSRRKGCLRGFIRLKLTDIDLSVMQKYLLPGCDGWCGRTNQPSQRTACHYINIYCCIGWYGILYINFPPPCGVVFSHWVQPQM